MEFSEEHISAVKNKEITEELNKDFKIKPFTKTNKNTVIFSMNPDVGRAKYEKKVEYSSSLLPKGLFRSGKKEEEFTRPKTIKDAVSIEREEERVIFNLNAKYHPGSMKKKSRY